MTSVVRYGMSRLMLLMLALFPGGRKFFFFLEVSGDYILDRASVFEFLTGVIGCDMHFYK